MRKYTKISSILLIFFFFFSYLQLSNNSQADNSKDYSPLTITGDLRYVNGIYGSGAPTYLGGIQYMCNWGNYIFVSASTDLSGDRITIVNITNPISPTIAGTVSTLTHNPRSSDVSSDGNYLFLASGNLGASVQGALLIFNVTDKANPSYMGDYHLPAGQYQCAGCAYVDSTKVCYVACWGTTGNALYAINCSDKTNPTFISILAGCSYPHDVWANATRAITIGHNNIVSGQATTIDVTDPTAMSIMDTYTTDRLAHPSLTRGFDIYYNEGQYAYFSSGGEATENNGGLFIFDVSDFSNIQPVSNISRFNYGNSSLNDFSSIFTNDYETILYGISTWSDEPYNVFWVFDITNKSNPVLISNLSGAGPPNYLGGNGDGAAFYKNPYSYIGLYADKGISIFQFNETSNKPQFLSIQGGSNGTILYNATPMFNWSKVNGTARYQLQISTDASFSSIIVNLTDICENLYPSQYDENATRVSFTLPSSSALPTYNRYYCRARALYA